MLTPVSGPVASITMGLDSATSGCVRVTYTIPTHFLTTMLAMAREGQRNPDDTNSRWLVYVGVILLALGVGALVYASIISYLNAIL